MWAVIICEPCSSMPEKVVPMPSSSGCSATVEESMPLASRMPVRSDSIASSVLS